MNDRAQELPTTCPKCGKLMKFDFVSHNIGGDRAARCEDGSKWGGDGCQTSITIDPDCSGIVNLAT